MRTTAVYQVRYFFSLTVDHWVAGLTSNVIASFEKRRRVSPNRGIDECWVKPLFRHKWVVGRQAAKGKGRLNCIPLFSWGYVEES